MTYEELVAKTREVFGKASAEEIEGHVAYQFNITGEGEGAFYLEINEGQIHIEPYEYYDRDVLFTTTADALIRIGLGELDPMWAVTTGELQVQGSIEKALLLKKLSVSIKEKLKEEAALTCGSSEETAEMPVEQKEADSLPEEETEMAPVAEEKPVDIVEEKTEPAEEKPAEAEAAEKLEEKPAEAEAAEKPEEKPAEAVIEEKKTATVQKPGNNKSWPNRKNKKKKRR